MKNLMVITLGLICRELEKEGKAKGKDWRIPRLYIVRNEASPNNVEKKLARMQKKNLKATEEDAKKSFLFPFYRNRQDHWRTYSREEAEDLKERIKAARGF